jgi:hypothetical protein
MTIAARLCASAAFMCILSLTVLFWQRQPQAQQSSSYPQYDSAGELQLPHGFETWVFVGSNLGLGYTNALTAMTLAESRRVAEQVYHNVYINLIGYSEYLAAGKFPDGTILVMDVYDAAQKEINPTGRPSVLNGGTFNGRRRGIEVAVKDSKRPNRRDDPQHLSEREWAYYAFSLTSPNQVQSSAPPFDDTECYSCHVQHAGDDNVWVQFYPTLRRVKQLE